MTTAAKIHALVFEKLCDAHQRISILEARVKELEEERPSVRISADDFLNGHHLDHGIDISDQEEEDEHDGVLRALCAAAGVGDPVWIKKLHNLREKYEQEICSCAEAPWIHMDHVSRPCEGFPNTCGDCEKFVPPEVRGRGGVPEEEPHCEKCAFTNEIIDGAIVEEHDDVCCVGCDKFVCKYNEEPEYKDNRDEALCAVCYWCDSVEPEE